MKKTVLVTGSSGFIGKNIAEYLSEAGDKYRVLSPLHRELELSDSAAVKEYFKRNKVDVVIHCANKGGSRKTNYDTGKTDVVKNNLNMFFNLASCFGSSSRMIFLGSGAEYAREHYKPRMDEDYFDTYVPSDDYGFSKYVCSKYIEKSENIINLRLFGVFGKYEDFMYRFISNVIVKNLFGLPIVINQNVFFDYLYVNDLNKIISHFIEAKAKFKFYNAVRGESIDLISIAKLINQIADKPSEITVKHPGLNTEYSADNSRLV